MRLAYFIDVSNVYLTVKKTFSPRGQVPAKLNFPKLKHYFDDYGDVVIARAYGAYQPEQNINKFIAMLTKTGFTCLFKEVRIFQNGQMKADWDVGIAIDAIDMLEQYDILILFSADGDFLPLVKYLQEKNKKVFIFGTAISIDLKDQADMFFEITESMLFEPKEENHENINMSDDNNNIMDSNDIIIPEIV